MLNTAYEKEHRPASPDPARVACHEDTCLFFGCKNLDAAYQHLLSHGVNLNEPKVAPYGRKQLWFSDPDGYGLCFQWPTAKENQDRWAEEYRLEPKAVA